MSHKKLGRQILIKYKLSSFGDTFGVAEKKPDKNVNRMCSTAQPVGIRSKRSALCVCGESMKNHRENKPPVEPVISDGPVDFTAAERAETTSPTPAPEVPIATWA